MKKSKAILVFLLLVLICYPSMPINAQDDILYRQDFDSEALDLWELEPGWEITAEDGNGVLQGEGHSWARLNVGLPETFRVSVRLRLLRGRVHLVTNLNNTGRYYFGFDRQRSDANKQYWPDLFEPETATGVTAHRLNEWYSIEIRGDGGHYSMRVNDQLEWEFTDPEPLGAGTFAFEAIEDTIVQIDDLIIFGSDGQPEQSPVEGPGSAAGWVRTGGPLGGLGYDVRMDPDNPDRMYVTDAFAGVFISEDGGRNWMPSNTGIGDRTGESGDAIPVFCLTVDPTNPDVVWAGTQYSGGIFKSTDKGRTWTRLTQGITINDGLTFRGISIDPTDPDTIYAAGELSSWVWAGDPVNGREFDLTKGVVYKSTNGGASWQEIWRGDNLARYILINPQDTDILYVSTGIFDREAANSDPQNGLPGGEGVIKSTDGGITWSSANNGLDNLYVGSLFMHPEDPNTLLAGTGNVQYYQQNGVYLTTDGAETWRLVHSGENIESVEFASSNADIAYAGSEGVIYRSMDRGSTWEIVSGGEHGWGAGGTRAGFPIDFQVDPRDPDRIFANNYGGGNFLSEDGGVTWVTASHGYTGAQVRDIAASPSEPGVIYAAARSGLFVSWGGGDLWSGIAYPPHRELEWNAIAINPENPMELLAANNWHRGLLASHDAGRTWEEVMAATSENTGVRVIEYAPSNGDRVYLGTSYFYSAGLFGAESPAHGLYRSDDGGKSWREAKDETSRDANVTGIAVSPTDADTVYAATGTGLLKSDDGGTSWRYLTQGLPANMILRSVAVDPSNSDTVLAGYWFGGVYRSTDAGRTWRSTSVGINPNAGVTAIAFDPNNSQIVYLADMFSGVYRSEDSGQSWRLYSEGLRMRTVNRLAFSSDGKHLYAATEGEGVFRLDLAGEAPTPTEPLFMAESGEEMDAPADERPPAQDEGDGQLVDESPPQDESESQTGNGSPGWCPGSYVPLMFTLALFWTARRDWSKK